MDHFDTAQAGAVLAAVGVSLALLAGARVSLLAGFALAAVGEALLARAGGGLALSPKVVGAGALALAVAVGATVVLARRPTLVLPLLVAAAPFRLPLSIDTHHRFLVAVAERGQLGRLLPLYGVLAVAALELCWRTARRPAATQIPRSLAVPAAAFLALSCLSLLWSSAESSGRTLLTFFLVPFGVLVAVGARAAFAPWLPRVLAIETVALAALFATVGIVEAATHRLLFFSPGLEISNAYSSYFRVTSLFRDPSLYGRHVVVGLAVVLVALFMRKLTLGWATALIALLWAGLFFSYSQSSLVALFVVVFAVTAIAGDLLARRTMAAVALLAASVVSASTQRATSDRSRRVELTARVFAHHPIAGVGIGAQPHATQLVSPRPGPPEKFVSHTTPLTVGAELGILGVLLYLALLWGASRVLYQTWRVRPALGLALVAVVLALFVHSLFYSGFFEDPITWLAVAIAANVVGRLRVERA